jgi:hypothetical protein
MVHRTISFAFGEPLLTIANNGLKLNDAAISDPKLTVDASALNSDGVLKLSGGKKKHVLVKHQPNSQAAWWPVLAVAERHY